MGRFPTAVVFDLDGTLVDTETAYRAAFFAAMEDLGWPFAPAKYEALVGLATPDRLKLLGPRFPAERFRQRYYARRSEMMPAVRARPGAVAVLASVARTGLPSAIATSASRRTALRHLAALPHRFDAVITRDEVSRRKPHPEPFLAAAASLGVAPADCLAVEDSAPGRASAKAAGMRVLGAENLETLARWLADGTPAELGRSHRRPQDMQGPQGVEGTSRMVAG